MITEEQYQKGLSRILKDGYISQIMVILSTGPFLVAYILLLGGSLFIIGLIAAIPPLCQICQIFGIRIVEKVRNRRKLSVIFLSCYRICVLMIGLIPFFFMTNYGLLFLILLITTQSIFAALGHTAWASWMHDFLPHEKLGAFFSRRIMLATIFSATASIIGGFFVDFWKDNVSKEIYAYSTLFIIAFCFGLVSIWLISKVPEPEMILPKLHIKLKNVVSEPFRDKNYRNLLIFLICWNFSLNLAAPFFVVYMLVRLKLSISIVLLFTALSQISNLVFLQIWGRLSDKFSNKSVLALCSPMYLFCVLLWPFTTLPEKYILTIPLLIIIHIFTGIAMAGITLSINNISYKLAPKGKGTNYLAVVTFISSLTLGIAPILGGLFINYFESRELSWTLAWTDPTGTFSFQTLNLQGFDFYFIFAFIIGLFSLHRLALIKEKGEVDNKTMFHELILELGKSIKNFSIVGGFRNLIINPNIVKPKNFKEKLEKEKRTDIYSYKTVKTNYIKEQ